MVNVDKAVLERRLKPIYDAIDNFNTKKAIQEAEKVLKKHPNTPAAKLLKALALIRAERFDEAFNIIDALDTEKAQHDESTLAVFVHCYKEAALPYRVCTLYERVLAYQPTEENLTQLFMAYVRTRQYNKQQIIATRLYKDFKNTPYFFWGVMSTYMQGKEEPEKMFFKLAMAKLDAYFKTNKHDGHSQVDLHMMVLESNKRYLDALNTLTEHLPTMSTASQFSDTRRLQLLLAERYYRDVVESAKDMLIKNRDDWTLWTLLFDAAFGLISTFEKGDSRISGVVGEISEAVNERCSLACKLRGPYLARLEWMSRLRAEGIETNEMHGEPFELLIGYVRKFFKKPCCYIDVKPYLQMLPTDMVMEFIKQYEEFVAECVEFDSGAHSDGSRIRSVILLNRLKRRLGHIDTLSKQEKCETISHIYHDLRMYSVDQLSGSDALQLIVGILWKEWVEKDDWKSFYECVLLLEWAARRFKACAFTKLMLCRAYGETGNLNRLIGLSKALDIKSVQRDTLGYFFFPMYETCGRFGLGGIHYDDLSEIYKTAEREITECMVTGYKNGSFAQLPELSDLYLRMKKSSQAVGASVMSRYMSGLLTSKGVDNSLEYLYGTHTAIDEPKLFDNRDLNVIPNFEHGDYAKEIDDVKEQTRQEFSDSIMLRDLICRGIIDTQPKNPELPPLKPDDMQYFDKLLIDRDPNDMTKEEKIEREIMEHLLKIKNGIPSMRKQGLREITRNARRYGAGPLFNQILPLLMSPSLEDQERHLMVKVIDRILYKLDDLVRPYVHKILVVIEPLLIDEDYYARVEGREIISNLAKAAGLATMISTMRPDIDNVDEYVRNTTARAFAVVASALGIPALLPFLKAVCKSKKSWQARHTGIKIVQQIAILMGCAVLPHLKALVDIVEGGLEDDQQKVRTITALCLAALAEAATPYGIEAFDSVLKPLWKGIRMHRGKGLAAFLKAIGYLIPLMDAEYASYYTNEVMLILIREFVSPDEEMKKIVLKVVKQCCATDGVEAPYIRDEILPPFFRAFWNPRMAMDRRNYRQLVDTTVEIAQKVGSAEMISRVVDDLKDENEQYRKMVMETIENIVALQGATEIDSRLEEQLIDGLLYAFQEQTQEDPVMMDGFGTVCNGLGRRTKPYLPQICGTILWRLNNKSAKVRQQAADLISRIAPVMHLCEEEKLMGHLGVVLYEYLGEEYPEVLGSILGALKGICNVIGMTKMTPPIKDLLPRLTPILKNRHEKVQENCIDLVGAIADRGSEFVSAREWMRICFELLELLKAHKKSIRRAAINTFGYIAKAIGPHDVLATLLNNLKVQERQLRVCTTVAIAIVSETCAPFTVLPAIMNEYRVPEMNVQNGVLKALSFMFEYIGEMAKDYIYAVTPLLIDAMMERDQVHRQIAIDTVAHLALGVYGFGCEDALMHLFNYVWPNMLENNPHIIQRFIFACEGMRVSLGPIKVLQYCLQALWHPARKVREPCWKVFNNLILGSQDALVAGYPRIEHLYDGDNRNYTRFELDYSL